MDETLRRALMAHTNIAGTFTTGNDMCITALDDGEAHGQLMAGSRHMNPLGIVHGGVYVTMMDQAAGTAACTRGSLCRTINCEVRFMASAGVGMLYSHARVVRWGRSIVVVHTRVETEDATICAEGTYTFRMKAGR